MGVWKKGEVSIGDTRYVGKFRIEGAFIEVKSDFQRDLEVTRKSFGRWDVNWVGNVRESHLIIPASKVVWIDMEVR
jgi:hypothetical protein